jgi:hypothetical protein
MIKRLWRWLTRRNEPTTFHKVLACHMADATRTRRLK